MVNSGSEALVEATREALDECLEYYKDDPINESVALAHSDFGNACLRVGRLAEARECVAGRDSVESAQTVYLRLMVCLRRLLFTFSAFGRLASWSIFIHLRRNSTKII